LVVVGQNEVVVGLRQATRLSRKTRSKEESARRSWSAEIQRMRMRAILVPQNLKWSPVIAEPQRPSQGFGDRARMTFSCSVQNEDCHCRFLSSVLLVVASRSAKLTAGEQRR
jgi:hypothetical protein